jgi:signal transduction histidine kinase
MAAKAADIVTTRTREVAEAFAPDCRRRGKTLVTRLDVLLPLAGDKELLAQMIANPVDSALSHTPALAP